MTEKNSSSAAAYLVELLLSKGMCDSLLKAMNVSLENIERKYPFMLSFLSEENIVNLNWLKRKANKQEINYNPSKKVQKDVASSSHANMLPNSGFTEGANSSQQRSKSKLEEKRMKNDDKKGKRKVGDDEKEQPDEAVELSREFMEKIEELNGSEVKFVLQKDLSKSDLEKNQGRLSIPPSKIVNKFLTENEKSLMDEREGINDRFVGKNVLVLDPCLRVCEMCFKKWPMTRSFLYCLTKTWNDTAINNNLKVNDTLQIWSFRINSQLCFALVKL